MRRGDIAIPPFQLLGGRSRSESHRHAVCLLLHVGEARAACPHRAVSRPESTTYLCIVPATQTTRFLAPAPNGQGEAPPFGPSAFYVLGLPCNRTRWAVLRVQSRVKWRCWFHVRPLDPQSPFPWGRSEISQRPGITLDSEHREALLLSWGLLLFVQRWCREEAPQHFSLVRARVPSWIRASSTAGSTVLRRQHRSLSVRPSSQVSTQGATARVMRQIQLLRHY